MASRRPLREGPPSPPPPALSCTPAQHTIWCLPATQAAARGGHRERGCDGLPRGLPRRHECYFLCGAGACKGGGGSEDAPGLRPTQLLSHAHKTANRAQGEPPPHARELVEATRAALDAAIRVCGPGAPFAAIGDAVQARGARRGTHMHACMRLCPRARPYAGGPRRRVHPPPFTHAARRRRCAHVRRARAGGPRHRARLPRGARRAAPQARSFSRARACLGRGTAVGPPPRGALIAGKHPRCVRSSPPTCPAPFPPAGMGAPAPCSWARPSP